MPNEKFLDKTGLTYLWSKLKLMFSNKVDKVTGKGLSTEDYTSAEKTKLSGIAENANNYTLPQATYSTLGGVRPGNNIDASGGVISVKSSSTSQKGVVQLYDGVDITSIDRAATANSVKTAYDKGDSAINYAADHGVKNLVDYNITVPSELTASIGADGGIIVTANTTAVRRLTISTDLSRLIDGQSYILSGCAGGNSNTSYHLGITKTNYSGIVYQVNGEVSFEKTDQMALLVLTVRSGQQWTKTFYPMIREANISSKSFKPYAPSNRELYEMILALQAGQ